jgi:hypothetical protein
MVFGEHLEMMQGFPDRELANPPGFHCRKPRTGREQKTLFRLDG